MMASNATQMAPTPEEQPTPRTMATHEQIAALAHALWEARAYPEGSPEQDWYQAEQQLKMRVEFTSSGFVARLPH